MANKEQQSPKKLRTKTSSPTGDDVVGSLEAKEKAGKSFFSRKNIIIMIIAFALSLALIGCTISFYMKIDFAKLFSNMGQGLTKELGWLWLTLLIAIFFMSVILSGFVPYWVKVRKFLKIPAWKWWSFGFIIAFLKATTPANFIYDPYTIFWLKTQGVSTSRATSLMFTNSLLWQMVQAFVTFPSFVAVMAMSGGALLNGGWEGQLTFAGMIIGMTIDFIGVVFMTLLCMSKTIHYRLSVIFNWFKKKIHMKYHTKSEIVEKYKTNAVIKADFIGYLRDWKNTLFCLLCYIVFELILYFGVYWSMMYINIKNYDIIFGFAFNAANISFTANRINILPGGILGLEIILKTLLLDTGAIKNCPSEKAAEEFANASILIWKSFGTYIPATIGLGFMVGITTDQIVRYKKNKHGFVDVKFDR